MPSLCRRRAPHEVVAVKRHYVARRRCFHYAARRHMLLRAASAIIFAGYVFFLRAKLPYGGNHIHSPPESLLLICLLLRPSALHVITIEL